VTSAPDTESAGAESTSAGTDGVTVAATVGTGVIGAGWASRLRLSGIDVRAFDPAPNASTVLDEVHTNAVAAWEALTVAPEPGAVGSLTMCSTIDEAVSEATFIVESAPERLDMKHDILGQIDAASDPAAIIASSTSGFMPSVLAEPLTHPERLIVGHPFNPVYLLPLVEVVAGKATDAAFVERAMDLYRTTGMHPLLVRSEVDGHIADRLLEAVWREALWLVNDGVATTEEIDDAIRYGFGLRWGQMGLFETYRIAGGLGGMRHFIAQFGEFMDAPLTKLMDVPELTDELIDTIAAQSDAQSGHHTVRELEQIRDKNLAAMLLALEGNRWGAGQTIADMRR